MYKKGFTIIELLVVIVVIGILATITVVSYSNITSKSIVSKRESDLTTYYKAIILARENTGKYLQQITNNGWSAGYCNKDPLYGGNTGNIEPKNLPKNHSCWQTYYNNLDAISVASGVNLSALKNGDANGNPYVIDENEYEIAGNPCRVDVIFYFVGNGTADAVVARSLPLYRCP